MITINQMIPATAPTRTRALPVCGYTDVSVLAHVDARPSVSSMQPVLVATPREHSVVDHNSSTTVRPNAAAGLAAFWAPGAVVGDAAFGTENNGRKQGRPPRREPR